MTDKSNVAPDVETALKAIAALRDADEFHVLSIIIGKGGMQVMPLQTLEIGEGEKV
ncbi:hypothetical protein [Pseudophaeobacter leonis]|uniref:hypothetical protein n=1 Tax=Pseudophaeobacter leonis TaxID=1144477 RepID=UPI0013747216|nr:hypothetical protein [Pseudophaeobacter leonis]